MYCTNTVIFCLLTHSLSLLLFLYGFFPTKVYIPGYSSVTSINKLLFTDYGGDCEIPPETKTTDRPEKRVVFYLVDALRDDFVFGELSRMKFVTELLSNGSAFGYHARARPPTVTMPRIKALTAGSTPAYVDFVLNFASPELTEDNWLYQLRSHEKDIEFYGDDTWLRLFPPHKYFARFDGVTSFFVADYTEVDNNVSRHIYDEISQSSQHDWSAMILHYLGLDHVGHFSGAGSPLIGHKLEEMDNIVRKLFQELKHDDVLILLGDHGMTDAGSHGGASALETLVPLVFISPAFTDGFTSSVEVEQVDVVPTLSAAMSIHIPQNSIGVILPNVILSLKNEKQAAMDMSKNAVQLRNVAVQNGKWSSDVEVAFRNKLMSLMNVSCNGNLEYSHARSRIDAMRKFLVGIREDVADSSTEYRLPFLIAGIALSLVVVGMIRMNLLRIVGDYTSYQDWIDPSNPYFSMIFILFLRILCLSSSSLIEEEHTFWYFMTTSWIVCLGFHSLCNNKKQRMSLSKLSMFILVLIGHRIFQKWNPNGDKMPLPGVGQELSRFPILALFLAVVAIFDMMFGKTYSSHYNMRYFNRTLSKRVCLIVAFFATVFYHIASHLDNSSTPVFETLEQLIHSFLRFRNIYVWIAYATGAAALLIWRDIPLCLLIVIALISRTTNILPIWFVFRATTIALHPSLSIPQSLMTVYLISMSSYFYLGNSNSLSTIDISVAYTGLTGYSAPIVASLTVLNLYAGPITCLAQYFQHFHADQPSNMHNKTPEPADDLLKRAFAIYCFQSSSCISYCILALIQRYHLFVWSVFAPKLLYETSHLFVLMIVVFMFAVKSTFCGGAKLNDSTGLTKLSE